MNEKQNKQTSKKITAGLAVLVGAAITSPIWLSYVSPDQNSNKHPTPKTERPIHDFRKQNTEVLMNGPYKLELLVQDGYITGTNFAVMDKNLLRQYKSLDQAKIVIPELTLVQQLNLETLRHETRHAPVPRENRRYHYFVIGYQGKESRQLLKYIIDPPKR